MIDTYTEGGLFMTREAEVAALAYIGGVAGWLSRSTEEREQATLCVAHAMLAFLETHTAADGYRWLMATGSSAISFVEGAWYDAAISDAMTLVRNASRPLPLGFSTLDVYTRSLYPHVADDSHFDGRYPQYATLVPDILHTDYAYNAPMKWRVRQTGYLGDLPLDDTPVVLVRGPLNMLLISSLINNGYVFTGNSLRALAASTVSQCYDDMTDLLLDQDCLLRVILLVIADHMALLRQQDGPAAYAKLIADTTAHGTYMGCAGMSHTLHACSSAINLDSWTSHLTEPPAYLNAWGAGITEWLRTGADRAAAVGVNFSASAVPGTPDANVIDTYARSPDSLVLLWPTGSNAANPLVGTTYVYSYTHRDVGTHVQEARLTSAALTGRMYWDPYIGPVGAGVYASLLILQAAFYVSDVNEYGRVAFDRSASSYTFFQNSDLPLITEAAPPTADDNHYGAMLVASDAWMASLALSRRGVPTTLPDVNAWLYNASGDQLTWIPYIPGVSPVQPFYGSRGAQRRNVRTSAPPLSAAALAARLRKFGAMLTPGSRMSLIESHAAAVHYEQQAGTVARQNVHMLTFTGDCMDSAVPTVVSLRPTIMGRTHAMGVASTSCASSEDSETVLIE